MKRLLPALLTALLVSACSAAPDLEDDSFQPVFGENDKTQSREKREKKQSEREAEKPAHSCTWEGDGGVKEDIRVFGPSDDAPFTKVEFIEYFPSDIDFEHEDEEAVDQYLEDVKSKMTENNSVDPSILDVSWEKGYVTLTYTCRNLKEVQSVHEGYLEDTVSYIHQTAAAMGGTTTCDGEPVVHDVPDIAEFDGDMQTIRDWTEANRENGKAFTNGTLDPAASQNFTDSAKPITDLVKKWRQNYNILNDQQRQTLDEVRNSYLAALLGN